MKQSDTEANSPIPYKYIDADNKVYKDPILRNDKGEISEDITPNQSMVSKNNKKKKDLNVDIENLSEDEIRNLIDEKSQSIQQLSKKTNNLQKKLKNALKQLNDKIQDSAEILYKKEANSTELQWLEEKYKTKQNLLNTEKKINHSYKVQYKILDNKLKNRNIVKSLKKNIENEAQNTQNINKTFSTKSLSVNKSANISNSLYMNIEDEILMIKNKNKEIIAEISKIKESKVSQQKKVDEIINGELELELRQKMEELQQLNMMKMDYEEKYKTLNRSMNMAKEKIKHFEEKVKKLEEKNELIQTDKLENYNFWMELIKKEINNNELEQLINLIKNDKSDFIKEIDKNRKIKKKKKLLKDASTEMIKENNNNIEEKKVNQNKNIYAIFSLLNSKANNNNNNKNNGKINKNNYDYLQNENLEIEKLLEDDTIYNLISENEYRELLNKKEEYIETSLRLDKTIENFIKTENSKYTRINKAIKDKLVQLRLSKEKNKLTKDEVNNLENIYQLLLEKENIKKEINQKMNFKQNKNNIIEKPKENNIISDKNYINQPIINSEESNKSNLKENISEEITNKEDDFPNTRDEQLKMIRKKYMEEEENNNNNENNDIENIEKNSENIKELNEDDKQFEQNEVKPEQQVPFKV
jgi:hypothetical protein